MVAGPEKSRCIQGTCKKISSWDIYELHNHTFLSKELCQLIFIFSIRLDTTEFHPQLRTINEMFEMQVEGEGCR